MDSEITCKSFPGVLLGMLIAIAGSGCSQGSQPTSGSPGPDGGGMPGGSGTCTNTCSSTSLMCQGNSVTSCRDHDGNGCTEWGVETVCPHLCDQGQCVECITDDDCSDPIRQECDYTTKTCMSRKQWATTTIDYSTGLERTLDNCYYCDATEGGSSYTLLRFQQGTGYTIWSLTLNGSFSPGTYPVAGDTTPVSVYLAESDPSVPSVVHGGYFSTSGTLTLTAASFGSGGTIDGSLSATLSGGSDGMETATLDATFHATFP